MNFDLIIIGGGINGAGIARDAALRGLKVLLLDKGDFASGTSSRSTKLIHGGIRYLENFEFKLVWEACHERKILTQIAPQLVHPMPFIIPAYQGDKRPLWLVRLGMLLYDLMAGFKNIHRHKNLNKAKISKLALGLKTENLQGGGVYYDCQTNDSWLTLANIKDAAQHCAVVKNYTRVMNITPSPETSDATKTIGMPHTSPRVGTPINSASLSIFCEDVLSGEKSVYTSPYIVNATGPWLDLNQQNWDIFKRDISVKSAEQHHKLRLTKGIHFFMPQLVKNYAILVSSKQDNRVFFIIPWGKFSLVGTTDTDYQGSPDAVKVEKADIAYLIKELQRLFPGHNFNESEIFGEYAGLRPLLNIEGVKTGAVSREYHLEEINLPEGTVLSVVGGKITTYRKLAQKVTDKVIKAFHHKKACQTHKKALPGSQFTHKNFEEFCADTLKTSPQLQKLDADIAQNLLQTYGSEITKLLPYFQPSQRSAATNIHPDTLERIIPTQPFIWGQLYYSIDHEWTKTAQDFIWRRTELYLYLKKYPQLETEIEEKIQKYCS